MGSRRAAMGVGPGVRFGALEVDVEPTRPLHRRDDTDLHAFRLQHRSLLYVQLEGGAHGTTHRLGAVVTDLPERLSDRHAIPVSSREPVVEREDAREHAGARASRERTSRPPRWSRPQPRSGLPSPLRGRGASRQPRAPPGRPAHRRSVPPLGWLSKWLPMRTGGSSRRPARRANMLPIASTETSKPSSSHQRRKRPRASPSSSDRASRRTPPRSVAPSFAISIRRAHRRSGSIRSS